MSSSLDRSKQDAQLGWPGVSHPEASVVLELKPQWEGRRDPDSVKTFRVGRETHRGREGRREEEREEGREQTQKTIFLFLHYTSMRESSPSSPSSPPIPLLLPDTDCCRLAVVL